MIIKVKDVFSTEVCLFCSCRVNEGNVALQIYLLFSPCYLVLPIEIKTNHFYFKTILIFRAGTDSDSKKQNLSLILTRLQVCLFLYDSMQ